MDRPLRFVVSFLLQSFTSFVADGEQGVDGRREAPPLSESLLLSCGAAVAEAGPAFGHGGADEGGRRGGGGHLQEAVRGGRAEQKERPGFMTLIGVGRERTVVALNSRVICLYPFLRAKAVHIRQFPPPN